MIPNDTSTFLLLAGIAAPFIGAVLAPLAYRTGNRATILVPLLSSLISAGALLALFGTLRDKPAVFEWRWVEALPLSFSLMVDGFGGLFALLVACMGVLIVWYAHHYMEHEEGKGRFFSFLLLFCGAMLGVALSDHFFTTFLFWELTSVSSFLLIGFWHEKEKSREGALKALFITSIGGLFLFAGLALLGSRTGIWTWSGIAAAGPAMAAQPWAACAFALILVGVFTKSAQFPFHIWLPDAMEAPTPVSAFLHSATMVKAGVFLLFRLHPFFSFSPFWTPLLIAVGMTTVLVGSVLALKHRDLKAILAYSTISQLGLFVTLHGYTGIDASFAGVLRIAFIFHIFVHAFYKGSLFMLTGIVDHAAHTRDIDKLGHLSKHMPRTTSLFVLSAASMAGLPLFLGFISKESILEIALEATPLLPAWGFFPLAGLAFSAAITVAVALKISLGIGFLRPKDPRPLQEHPPHEASLLFLLPPGLLALAGLFFGIFPNQLVRLLYPGGLVGILNAQAPSFSLWHGITAPLLISVGAVTAGTVLFWFRYPVFAFQESFKFRRNINTLYNSFWDRSLAGAKWATETIQNGSLTRYSAVLIGAFALAGLGTAFSRLEFPSIVISFDEIFSFEALVIAGLVISSILVVVLKDQLARIISLGAVGILLCAFFTLRGAPDLALTGFLVEIVVFIVILLVLKQLKPETPKEWSWLQSAPRAILAGLGGLAVGVPVFFVLENALAPSIHPYFFETAPSLAGGLNVVNVILVDFRGFDTMGEILVLCLAGLGVFGLRQIWMTKPTAPPAPDELKMRALPPSEILVAISAICVPIIIVFSLYLTLKGHNYPGGGFIGGLVCAGGLVLEMLAVGEKRFLKRFPIQGRVLYGTGLVLAFATGFGSLLLGFPFLTSAVFEPIHFSTAGIFDLGVFLIVVGVTLEMITLLEEAERKAAER